MGSPSRASRPFYASPSDSAAKVTELVSVFDKVPDLPSLLPK
jgi:hypothetical protein